MTYNYLTDNLGQISMLWMVLIALVMAGLGIWIAWMIPALAGKEKDPAYHRVCLVRGGWHQSGVHGRPFST